jgi:hypothetical protein
MFVVLLPDKVIMTGIRILLNIKTIGTGRDFSHIGHVMLYPPALCFIFGG